MEDFKKIYMNYFLLITIILFVVIYYYINYKNVVNGTYTLKESFKPLLWTVTITVILYLVCCEDGDKNNNMNKTFKIVNKYQDAVGNSNSDNGVFIPQNRASRVGLKF
jgi:hypothetical protein